MSLPCTGNRVSARKRAAVRTKAETGSETGATGDYCHMPASDRRPVRVPPLQDVSKFKPRGSAHLQDRGQVIGAPNETRGNAREENETMMRTDDNAANAQADTPSLDNTHGLRLTALLFDLVEARGRRGAAQVLGVSYGALARAADTGRLTGRMRDALTRHLLGDTSDLDGEHREHLAKLEQRVAALEDGAGETSGDEDAQLVELRKAAETLIDEQERHGRRIAALETRGPTPPTAPVSVGEHSTRSRPADDLVVSLHPDPGDDETRFGAAAPLIVEWRRLRAEYGAAPDALAKLRAEDELLVMEILLIAGCGVTLSPADYPWDRFDLEDQTRRRKRRLSVVRTEVRRAEFRRRIRRICTLGIWRR